MKDFAILQALIGNSLKEEELKFVDCYAQEKLGLFIPSVGTCGYAQRADHTHPSYMIVIYFSFNDLNFEPTVEIGENQYFASILSPNIPHTDLSEDFIHYYCILINKPYFEQQYRLYTDEEPDFLWKQFTVGSDILTVLNAFASEYSSHPVNENITLDAQATILTHKMIRSIRGEGADARPVSQNYCVARAQHYIQQHFSDSITVGSLAQMGHMSESNFTRTFKRETGLTPIEYLIEIRIEKSKKLLQNKAISITEIAAACGFGSSAHFAAAFKRLLSITPSEYRYFYK